MIGANEVMAETLARRSGVDTADREGAGTGTRMVELAERTAIICPLRRIRPR
jgi:hypothetical protein